MKKIIGVPGFVKDEASGAILNTDETALTAYRKHRLNIEKKNERIDKLERDMTEIKNMLKEILNKSKE